MVGNSSLGEWLEGCSIGLDALVAAHAGTGGRSVQGNPGVVGAPTESAIAPGMRSRQNPLTSYYPISI